MKKRYTLSIISILLISTILCSFWGLPVSAAAESEAMARAKIELTLLEKMESTSSNERIPVAIWYKDIDQTQVDSLTKEKVGFSQDNIAVTYEMPSTELLYSIKNNEADAKSELSQYFSETNSLRKIERFRSDTYISSRREISRQKYNEKSSSIIKQLDIKESDILFKSEYAPLVEIEATSSTIVSIAKNINVLSIEYIPNEEINVPDSSKASNTDAGLTELEKMQKVIGHTDVITKLNLSGENVNIGMYESGGNITADNTEVPRDQFYTVGAVVQNGHVNNTASILIGSVSGFAKDAIVYSTNTTKSYIEAMITTNGIKLMNVSLSSIPSYEKWVNHLVAHHSVTAVASAGNIPQTGINVITPAKASNVIAVGAYDISDTVDLDDDVLCDYSAYEETAEGISKPDVIMSADVLGEGTSSSAPVLTACIALMFELKPSLAMHPQAVKAIVLASCHRKVNSSSDNEAVETMLQGITERQGAGAPDIWKMACIVSNGTYGIGTINPQKTIGTRRFVLPAYGSNYANVSIAWLNENKHGSNFSSSNIEDITDGEDANLNLSVYRHGSHLKSSNLSYSSTEMVYFPLNSYTDYEMRVTKASTCEEPVRYGYAYCLDNPYISRVSDDGIYYLRNYYYDTYLTLDPSTGRTSLQPFTGADTQKWILQKSSDVSFKLISGYGSAGLERSAISLGTNISGSTYNATAKLFDNNNSMIDMDFQLLSNSSGLNMKDGAVAFFYPDPERLGDNYILTCQNGAGALTKCSMNASINDYRSWVLENVNYRQGDSNMDEKFTVKDATLVEKYIANIETLNNQQMFLADVNCDSIVNVQDSTLINKILAKQAIY